MKTINVYKYRGKLYLTDPQCWRLGVQIMSIIGKQLGNNTGIIYQFTDDYKDGDTRVPTNIIVKYKVQQATRGSSYKALN